MAVLSFSKKKEAAMKFARFVVSPRGRQAFKDFGFSPARPEDEPKPTTEPAEAGGSLHLYCGAGIQPPVAEVIEAFQTETGANIALDPRGSGILLSTIKQSQKGDLYLPGDVHFVEKAGELGLMRDAEPTPVFYFVPVILVEKGNPKGIAGLADLAQAGLKVALGDAEATAIGRLTKQLLEKNGVDADAVERNVVDRTVTVNDAAMKVRLRAADAAIVWDAIAAQYADSTDVVPIPASQNIVSHVGVGVLKFSKNPALADRFIQFLTGPKGKAIFRMHHYTVDKPE
jgi:molybdate transport system substrate-binding protein